MTGLSEFQLIDEFFADCGAQRPDVHLGVGDDAALLAVPPGHDLAVTQDTLVQGVHFPLDSDPRRLGHKSLAVNLSDLAAMGATPAWVTLALTLPEARAEWLSAFAEGFCSLAREHGVRLVGGDTTRGPLAVSVCAHGLVPRGEALRRGGGRRAERVWVTGTLGDAGLALRALSMQDGDRDLEALLQRLEQPEPRVSTGLLLRRRASAAIDVSDGLLADLGHLARASGVGAEIRLSELPLSVAVARYVAETGDWSLPLSAGDDYELCFTLPADQDPADWGLPCPVRCIGELTAGAGVRVLDADGKALSMPSQGYQHFHRHD
jgi:thiamine-monophosphate kinase